MPTARSSDWAQEISLDLDVVSAICPKCNILLVEANSASFSNLAAAVNYAASRPDVVAISISYGGSEFLGETAYDSAYHHSGKAITVSSGDNGYGVEIPAASPFVTAVGGTSLHQASNTGGRTAGWFGERRREARQDRNGRAFAAVACVGDWPVLPTW